MNCSEIRTSISAMLDGEHPLVPMDAVDAHLLVCVSCHSWSIETAGLQRACSDHAVDAEPDRTAAIMMALPVPQPTVHDERTRTLRLATFVIALVQLGASVPLLVGDGYDLHGHLSRHVGVFSVALAVGLLIVVRRPERSHAILPMLAVIVVGLLWSCLGDLLAGHPLPGSAIAHAADVAGLTAVWLLARSDVEVVGTNRRPAIG